MLITSSSFPLEALLWTTLPFSWLLSSLAICHRDFFLSSDTKLSRPCSKFSRQTMVYLVLGYSSVCHLECLYSQMTFWDPSESPGSWIRLSSKSSAMVWFLSLFCKISVVAQTYLLLCWYRDGLKLLIWTRSSVSMELRFKNRKTEELQTTFLLPHTRYPLSSSNRHLSTSGPLNISQTALLSVCGCSSQLLCVRREIPFRFSRLTFVLLATLLFSSPSTKTKMSFYILQPFSFYYSFLLQQILFWSFFSERQKHSLP